ncbi:MAG: hypothetical protein HYX92_21940 [Chloroflexi bacterium]|nr:hypothetical protein [Chloroflexota bacterium]
MNREMDVFAISGVIALALVLLVVNLLGFTNVRVAGLTLVALPFITVGLVILIGKTIKGRRRRAARPSRGSSKEGSPVGRVGAEFTQAWLDKGKGFIENTTACTRVNCGA